MMTCLGGGSPETASLTQDSIPMETYARWLEEHPTPPQSPRALSSHVLWEMSWGLGRHTGGSRVIT
jgi:hypothetical protein